MIKSPVLFRVISMTRIFITLLILSLSAGLLSVEAARERISLAPDTDLYTTEDIEKEIIFGREMAAIILGGKTIHYEKNINRYVSLVGHSLLRFSSRSELNFNFAVVESDEINAYATPGGYIFVTTGALSLMQNEAELAGVLAHEIAHVADRHIVRALKIRADDKSTTALISKIATNNVESAKVVFDQAVGQAVEILFSKGLKVADENEADLQGALLTTMAGYDPMQYVQFLSRIQPVIEGKEGELNQTHPPFEDRINRLRSIIGEEGLLLSESTLNTERFLRNISNGGIQ